MDKQEAQKELNKLSRQIVKGYKPDKIILFGSFTNKRRKKVNDIDLLVIKKTKKDHWKRVKDISKIVSGIKLKIPKDILNISTDELNYRLSIEDDFLKSIIKTGKTIYEK